MRLRLVRRVAIALLALLAFAHASLALAACNMDRGSMAEAMAMADMPDCQCGTAEAATPGAVCASHCASDLQLSGLHMPLVRAAANTPVLVVEAPAPRFDAFFAAPPRPAPPRRILLHSFLI